METEGRSVGSGDRDGSSEASAKACVDPVVAVVWIGSAHLMLTILAIGFSESLGRSGITPRVHGIAVHELAQATLEALLWPTRACGLNSLVQAVALYALYVGAKAIVPGRRRNAAAVVVAAVACLGLVRLVQPWWEDVSRYERCVSEMQALRMGDGVDEAVRVAVQAREANGFDAEASRLRLELLSQRGLTVRCVEGIGRRARWFVITAEAGRVARITEHRCVLESGDLYRCTKSEAPP